MEINWQISRISEREAIIIRLRIGLKGKRNKVAVVELIVGVVNASGSENTGQMIPHIILNECRKVGGESAETGSKLLKMATSNVSTPI